MRLLLTLLLSLGACASTQSASTPSELADEGVRQAFSEFRRAIAKGDWDRAVSYYADDPRFNWVEDGKRQYSSVEEVRTALTQLANYGASITMEYTDPQITMLNRDTARLFTTYSMKMGVPGEGGFATQGAFTAIMSNRDGRWQFLMGHSSSEKARGEHSDR